ncbi:MAG TPA: hypothetical protein VH279_10385 [Solirubrobacteraceae bacterium]|nr:hypothetical protein [Solirubrobacteraceae bacterium]
MPSNELKLWELPEEFQIVEPTGLIWLTDPFELNVVVVPNRWPSLVVMSPVLGS